MSKTIIVPEELYHVYNRGTEKRNVFMSKADYNRFVELLFFCNSTDSVRIDDLRKNHSQGSTLRNAFGSFDRSKTIVEIFAYCLMPNHFHLLIKEKVEGGTARFMQKLITGYTMYFNTRRERTGALFQGRYKAQHIDDDRYLKYLVSYIHLNPVKIIEPNWKETGIKSRISAQKYLSKYPYSSYPDYSGKERAERHILSMQTLAEYYDSPLPKNFKESVEEWLKFEAF